MSPYLFSFLLFLVLFFTPFKSLPLSLLYLHQNISIYYLILISIRSEALKYHESSAEFRTYLMTKTALVLQNIPLTRLTQVW
jgi:hypothetical protein